MIILDTNVLFALMQQTPDERVVSWLDGQPRSSIWTTSVNVLEVLFGLEIMAVGKRRNLLAGRFDAMLEKMERRIASLDDAAARDASHLMAARTKSGRTVEIRDTMIAGIALAHHASLATRNVKDFDDTRIPLVNPWSV